MSTVFKEFARSLGDGDRFEGAVKYLVENLGACGAVVWNCGNRPFQIVAQHYSGKSIEMWCTEAQHVGLLTQVKNNRRAAIVSNDNTGTAPPILIAPIDVEAPWSNYLIELIYADQADVPDPSSHLNQLIGICNFLRGSSPESNIQDADFLASKFKPDRGLNTNLNINAFEKFSSNLHQSIDRTETCLNVVNEARLLTDCDRVSVVLKRHGKFKTMSISGQPSVNRRSSTVLTLEKLVDSVLNTGNEFWFPSTEELAPQIQLALDDYFETSNTRSIAILPITEFPDQAEEDPDFDRSNSDPNTIGGIVFEHARIQWESQQVKPALRMTVNHCAIALRNALTHQSLFLYPLWRALGGVRGLTSRKTLPKTIIFAAILTVALLALTFWKTSYYVSVEGEFLPVQRRMIFPQTEGEVAEVLVKNGQFVQADETLAILRSKDLNLKIEDTSGRLETLIERKESIQRRKFEANATDRAIKDENLRAIQTEIDSLNRQLVEYKKMAADLRITSPIAGQVITWDVEQVLKGRMVNPQNQLMEIADTSADWELVVEVPDKHADQILKAWANGSGESPKLEVKFSLASEPGNSYSGQVIDIGSNIQLNQDNEPVLRVRVQLDSTAVAVKKARSRVFAKIYTGEDKSLAYLWLGEIPDAFRRYIMFYFVE